MRIHLYNARIPLHAARWAIVVIVAFISSLAKPPGATAQYWMWGTQDSLTMSYTGRVHENVSYLSIAAADSLHCIAACFIPSTSAINRTTDAGRSWHVVLTDSGFVHGRQSPIKFRAVAHPTPGLLIVVGDSGTIMRSGDGGATWQRIACDAVTSRGATTNLFSVSMCDSVHGVATGFSEVLLRTDDGGRTWERILEVPWNARPGGAPPPDSSTGDPAPTMAITDAACLSPSTYLLALWGGNSFYMLRTEDAGRSWTRVEADTVQSLCFVDSLRGWGAGSGFAGVGHTTDEIIIRTEDGGRSWQTLVHQPSTTVVGYVAVAFADRNNGFVAAYDGRILRTTDGGSTWGRTDSIRRELNFSAQCLAYPVPGTAWAGTTVGQILSFDVTVVSGIEAVAGASTIMQLRAAPNVSGAEIHVEYVLGRTEHVTLELIDMRGIRMMLIRDGVEEAGRYDARIDASTLAMGAYLVRIRSSGGVATERVMVVR